MPCSLSHPCGGSLRVVLVVDGRTIRQCLNAHTHMDHPAPTVPDRLISLPDQPSLENVAKRRIEPEDALPTARETRKVKLSPTQRRIASEAVLAGAFTRNRFRAPRVAVAVGGETAGGVA